MILDDDLILPNDVICPLHKNCLFRTKQLTEEEARRTPDLRCPCTDLLPMLKQRGFLLEDSCNYNEYNAYSETGLVTF